MKDKKIDLNKQRIIVDRGRNTGSCYIPYEILYSEIVANSEIAKERVKQLKEEYRDIEYACVHFYSL